MDGPQTGRFAMTKLNRLHLGLARLRRYRTVTRVVSAVAVSCSIVLWVFVVAFLLDVSTHMGRFERLLVLVISGGLFAWAIYRFLLPAFATHEDDLSLALMIEREQDTNSQLVAGLQFSDATRPQYGSSQLREAVVDLTGKISDRIDYLRGFSRGKMFRGLALLLVTAAIVLVGGWKYGTHVRVFFNRFVLGDARYPTRTVIEGVLSPGDMAMYGQPVIFKVRVGGELPPEGEVRVRGEQSAAGTVIRLLPDENDHGLFVGQLGRGLEDLSYTIRIGDDSTDPKTLSVIPPPIVNVDLTIQTPAYAAAKFAVAQQASQATALEGSRVVPVVTADKPLKSAAITIDDKTYPLVKEGDSFTLVDPDTPLSNVSSTLHYEVHVEDADGIRLPRPVSGTLQVRKDRPPRIAAATVTYYVVPTAAPEIKFRAIDDYGLDRIEIDWLVERQGPDADDTRKTTVIAQVSDHRDQMERRLRLPLADLNLAKGDRVTLTFRAVDFRGSRPGKAADSDRVVFQVTDRAGILDNMRLLGEQMDEKLDQIIKAQLGIED
jgi:hypothetical protein